MLHVSSLFHQLGLPHLYRKVTLTSRHALSCFLRTLKTHPEYSRYVCALEVYSARINWNEAIMMARMIDRAQTSHAEKETLSGSASASLSSQRVKTLRVRFPADDIAQALDFFRHFAPEHFEWITQPCWLLRPGELFMRYLVANWSKSLRTLRLGNFDYDAASFAPAISSLPGLTQLTLMGSSNRQLDPDTVRTILGTGETATSLRWLWISDCPQRRRTLLEAELKTAIPIHHSVDNAGLNSVRSSDEFLTTDLGRGESQGRFETTAGCIKFCPRCRTQARERVMQRYSTVSGAHVTRSTTSDTEANDHGNAALLANEIMDIDAAAQHIVESPSHARHEFVRRRVLESMRWLP